MKLCLRGHGERYDCEQILISLFPDEKSEVTEKLPRGGGDYAVVSVRSAGGADIATVTIRYRGRSAKSVCRCSRVQDELQRKRDLRMIIKRAFFRAAKKITGESPEWGALTGVRPAKIASKLLAEGLRYGEAVARMRRDYFVSSDRAFLCVDAARAGIRAKALSGPRDISLYVGIPFCPSRCAYCSFISHDVLKSAKLVEPYLLALEREIEAAAELVEELGLRVRTVYVGGGTPAVLRDESLNRLFRALARSFDFSSILEYTVEAGRADVITPGKLSVMRNAGVTRVSVNPQTTCDDILIRIGRRHTAAQFYEAMGFAREVGFGAVNADLIAGLPGDSAEGFAKSLDSVLAFEPENITVHTFAVKKGSRFAVSPDEIPGSGEVGRMLKEASAALMERGYAPYYLYRQKYMTGSFENVGWTKPGFDCLYNIYIMEELHSIISMGAGAVTKIVIPSENRIERIFNPKYPYEYISGIDGVIRNKDKFYNAIKPHGG